MTTSSRDLERLARPRGVRPSRIHSARARACSPQADGEETEAVRRRASLFDEAKRRDRRDHVKASARVRGRHGKSVGARGDQGHVVTADGRQALAAAWVLIGGVQTCETAVAVAQLIPERTPHARRKTLELLCEYTKARQPSPARVPSRPLCARCARYGCPATTPTWALAGLCTTSLRMVPHRAEPPKGREHPVRPLPPSHHPCHHGHATTRRPRDSGWRSVFATDELALPRRLLVVRPTRVLTIWKSRRSRRLRTRPPARSTATTSIRASRLAWTWTGTSVSSSARAGPCSGSRLNTAA